MTVQHSCSIEEERSVNRFLCSEGVKTDDIYRRVTVEYGSIRRRKFTIEWKDSRDC
jgi:hypothetical protein